MNVLVFRFISYLDGRSLDVEIRVRAFRNFCRGVDLWSVLRIVRQVGVDEKYFLEVRVLREER